MLAKLAIRNVRRSGRDYAIYFITVTLGVAMFYAFNALHSQAVLFDALSTDSIRMLDLLTMLIGLFSVVVAGVLGFLVVYANRFLIRRRRREFGMYLLLGMNAGHVSRVLLYETVIVGLLSLVAGLVLGVAISQGLSFVAAALMGTTMTKYRFIFSGNAAVLTAACFVAIFALSALVDVVYIRRCKLITLLSAREANERSSVGGVGVRVVGFACSVALLSCAYWQLAINGMRMADGHFWAATVLMLLGTVLFFWSVAGFAIFALTHAKGIYLRGIRMFTVRQIASKVNTAFVSMAVVCVMLFFALTTASIGMGLIEIFAGNIDQVTRYDATIVASDEFFYDDDLSWQDTYRAFDGDIAACLASRSGLWGNVVRESAQLDYWPTGVAYQTLLDQVPQAEGMANPETLDRMGQSEIDVLSASQYNACCALIGEPGIQLANDEFAMDNAAVSYDELAMEMVGADVRLELAGTTLHGSGTLQAVPLQTSAISETGMQLVVPDEVAAALREAAQFPTMSYLNVMYRGDRMDGDVALSEMLREASPLADDATPASDELEDQYEQSPWPVSNVYTGRAMADQAGGLRMVITFIAVYIGFVMLVATAAVLAIQQLSETTDSLQRYDRLSDLGCDLNQVFASLRTQTTVYFCAPLVLAACHSTCAVLVICRTLFDEMGVNPTRSVAIAAGTILSVYALYLAVTYALSKSIVRSSMLQRRRAL